MVLQGAVFNPHVGVQWHRNAYILRLMLLASPAGQNARLLLIPLVMSPPDHGRWLLCAIPIALRGACLVHRVLLHYTKCYARLHSRNRCALKPLLPHTGHPGLVLASRQAP